MISWGVMEMGSLMYSDLSRGVFRKKFVMSMPMNVAPGAEMLELNSNLNVGRPTFRQLASWG